MGKKKKEILTENELFRYYEIEFTVFIQKIYTYYDNPIRIYEYVEIMCVLTKCSPLIINNIVAQILSGDRRAYYTRTERAVILGKLFSITGVCTRMRMGMQTYYKLIKHKEIDIIPHFDNEQCKELQKFFSNSGKIFPERIDT